MLPRVKAIAEEGHPSPKVLEKYYSIFDWCFCAWLRAFTSETHVLSETARTGAAAGHSGESGWEDCHAPLRGSPLAGTTSIIIEMQGGVTHVIIVATLSCCIYCMPSSPVLLHIYCPDPVLLHIYCTCFSTFWHCHNYILQHFNVFTPLFHWFFIV